MEGDLVWVTVGSFRIADLAILLGFGKLGDDGYS